METVRGHAHDIRLPRLYDDNLPDEVIHEMIENARFSPSGGNRQGNRVIIVRDMATRQQLST